MDRKLTSALMITTAILFAGGASAAEITIASSGGNLAEGGRNVLWGPAAKKLGHTVLEDTISEGLNSVRLQVNANAVTYDIVQMAAYEGALGGMEGVLQPLDYDVIDVSTFLPGTAGEYCVGFETYAFTIAWNKDTFGENEPQSWSDFWNVEKFPGRRGMRANAEAQIEAALLADGVSKDDLYEVMSTSEGVERAIAKLEEIKPHISVWWTSGAQVAQLLRDGEVDLTTGWNGRYQTAINDGANFGYLWNTSILGTDCYAVPAGAPNAKEAMEMLNLMSAAEPQALLVPYTKYGPTNAAAFDTRLISEEMALLLPTHPDNSAGAVVQDPAWWAANNDAVQEMFDEMLTR